jgi:demethylmenaquinone methyltransferase/2-methoxy-6-polyprenyl-1,4-benzoquinol methylase/phosphoethanolamine N-methyltransferase
VTGDHSARERATSLAPHTEGKTIHWARLYDLGTTFLSFGLAAVLRRRTVELAEIAPGERVLDVGCGPGRLAIAAAIVAGAAGETRGIDPAPEMVELARRKAARAGVRAQFDVGVIEKLPYPDGHFDVVLSSLMLHHLPDELKRRGFAEARRVIRPGGRLVAVEFGATPGDGIGHVICVLGLRTGWDHAEHLRAMFREAGFTAVEMGAIGLRALAFVRGRKPAVGPGSDSPKQP